jgi:hypothetical protein
MRKYLRSIGIARVALALLIGCFVPVAKPCSIFRTRDVPISFDHYAFYGEVLGYASVKVCGYETEPAPCAPSWGLRISILEPVYVPGRNVTEVEYFEFAMDSMCNDTPMPEELVRQQYPVGRRIALAASLYTADEPKSRRIRLTILDPPIGAAIAVLPMNADLRKLAATPFDYVRFADIEPGSNQARVNFELWRDKLRLQRSRTEREALSILLRVAATDELGEFASDDEYSAIEQLVDQHLPTPSIREEFTRRLRDARYDAGAMDNTEKRAVAFERAQQGDRRAMYDYAKIIHHLPRDDKDHDPQSALEWMRRSASAGFFPAAWQLKDYAMALQREVPDKSLTKQAIDKDAEEQLEAAEKGALLAARRGDPIAYLFLRDYYAEAARGPPPPWGGGQQADDRKKAKRFSCLLARHPDSDRWLGYSSTGLPASCPDIRGVDSEVD